MHLCVLKLHLYYVPLPTLSGNSLRVLLLLFLALGGFFSDIGTPSTLGTLFTLFHAGFACEELPLCCNAHSPWCRPYTKHQPRSTISSVTLGTSCDLQLPLRTFGYLKHICLILRDVLNILD